MMWKDKQVAAQKMSEYRKHCEYHVQYKRKLNRERKRIQNAGAPHDPNNPDRGYKDRIGKGVYHNNRYAGTTKSDQWLSGCVYERSYDRFDSPDESFLGITHRTPLDELLEQEEAENE